MLQRLFSLAIAPVLMVGVVGEALGEDIDFDTQVRPILADNCFECHGVDRQRGDLRLDTFEGMLRGGDLDGAALVPGDPEESPMYWRTTLDPGHIDVMPPDEDDQLTEEQQQIIYDWIAQGADFGDGGPIVVPEAEPEALEALREAGALAMPLARDTNLIMVDFRAEAENVGDSHMDLLQRVAEQLAWLNLSNTHVTDEGLEGFANFENLQRLSLDNTGVGDAGLEHLKGLERLEYLNLYGNEGVTDAGMVHLAELPALARVYLWQTEVTEAGAEKLAEALPEIQIDRGWENRPEIEVVEVAEARPEPVNDTCPVSGESVDPAFTVVLNEGEENEQVVGFCCDNCRQEFDENPDEFEVEVAAANREAVNDECPISGQPVVATHVAVFEDTAIGFCCADCLGQFNEDPESFRDEVAQFLE